MGTTKLTDDSYYQNIADAIRAKNGSTTKYKPRDMAEAINSLNIGIVPSGTFEITRNGLQNITEYAAVNVNVAASEVTSGTRDVSENGTYDVSPDDFAEKLLSKMGPIF